MTERFKNKIIPFLFKWEGTEYENDPDDPGGATKYGIDQRSHPSVNIKNLTAEEATEIYWDEWVKDGCEDLPEPLDWIFFDACVNCGIGRANKLLKASGKNPSKFQDERIAFYNRLVEAKPVMKKYLKGWTARVKDLSKVAGVV
jgi:lysozyme family protein